MCLVSKQKQPCIAEKDIEIYKLVVKRPNSDQYLSLFEKFPYELNKEYEENGDPNQRYFNYNTNHSEISQGWFHSYSDYTIAIQHLIMYISTPNWDVFLLPGVIPKGTPYYIGLEGDVCSKKIKLIGKCV